jgi:hypothetical protein
MFSDEGLRRNAIVGEGVLQSFDRSDCVVQQHNALSQPLKLGSRIGQ